MDDQHESDGNSEEVVAEDAPFTAFGQCIFCLMDIPHEAAPNCIVEDAKAEDVSKIAGRIYNEKEIGEFKDPISSGRKRAANILPTESMGVCEWKNLKFAGGGVHPIVGCLGNHATDRHHGPDKSTLNNTRPGEGDTNLHAICSFCHNAWHAANDPYYGENGKDDRPADNSTWIPVGVEWQQHDPSTKASQAELLMVASKRLAAEGIK